MISVRSLLALCFAAMFVGTISAANAAVLITIDKSTQHMTVVPMPHSIFFTKRGHAIHGSYHTHLGHPVSRGCVRLSPGNAAKLYALIEREGLSNTTVDVTGSLSRGRERRHESHAGAVPE